jgi:hypothetical protein
MSNEESAQEKAIAAELREYALGNLDVDHEDMHPIAGLIPDDDVRDMLMFMHDTYTGPGSFWETEYAREIIQRHATDIATNAIQNGDMDQMQFFSGLVGYQQDVSGMQALMDLQRLIEETPVFVSYIFGLMGSGKTDFAFLLLEVFASVYGEDSVHMVANVSSNDIDETVTHYSRVVDMLEARRERMQAGEDPDPIVIIIDEAAQIFSGSGADQHRAKQLAKLLKLARKSNANILMIGQDGKDIGPSLRSLCTVFVEKKNQKTAAFYYDVKNREGVGEIMTLSGVPATSYNSYSTYDEGDFVFDDEDGEEDGFTQAEVDRLLKEYRNDKIKQLIYDTELSTDHIAEVWDLSPRQVRRIASGE